MCGITGAFGIDGPLPAGMAEAVRRMTDAIAHRGPDGDGFYNAPRVSLAQRRLAIIDIALGHQPMANEDESCWITFNGEIYNYREVRPLLESRGHRFRTNSDTETILHAYEEFGPACVDRLEGMFAFAIYDGRKQELFVARDRLGTKPFYYSTTGGVFQFASELPALRHSPLWRGDVDLSALESYFSLGYFLEPATVYRHVRALMPGHWLRIANGRIETRQYWDVREFDTDDRPDEELLKDIDETLRRAVHERLESEVPLGAFLSGGIDSGLIVSYMAEALGDRLVTTSVGFGEREHNELEAAELTARHVKSRHYSELLTPNLAESLAPVTSHLGQPMADSSAIPTWYVSRAARKHVTVALSGDGGDEAWAGYDFRYVPHAAEERVRRRLPGPVRRGLAGVGRQWPRDRRVPKPLRAGTVLENIGRDSADAYFSDLTFLKTPEARRLMGLDPDARLDTSPAYAAVTDAYRRCTSDDPVQKAEYADLKIYLPNDPLVKVDRMSMAHGLEVRCPLLDRKVVELAFRIPAKRKQVGSKGKHLLRALASRRLPAALATMPKKGFTAPIGAWIAGPQLGMFQDEVLGGGAAIRGHLDVADLEKRLAAQRAGTADESHALWAAWVLERWLTEASRHG